MSWKSFKLTCGIIYSGLINKATGREIKSLIIIRAILLLWKVLSNKLGVCINRGIKHAFLCINISWTTREVLKSELEMHQKIMFDRYYCIKTLPGNMSQKLWRNCVFSVARNLRKGTFTTYILKMPLPWHILTSWWRCIFTFPTMHITGADIIFCDSPVFFCDGPGTLTFKSQIYIQLYLTAHELPC